MLIGVLSDAHGNIGGFRQAIRILAKHGADRFVFLGDAVGYIPSVDVVCELMSMGTTVKCIRGNHEAMLLTQTPSAKENIYQLRRTAAQMSSREQAFLNSWPEKLVIDGPFGPALFVHGSPDKPTTGCVYLDTDLSVFKGVGRWVFMGHTHRAFVRRLGTCNFVNAGSCGLPRDNGHLGAAVLLDLTGDRVELLRFNIRADLEKAFAYYAPVHEDVLRLLNRSSRDNSAHHAIE
jgi:predicted phosphodiesterase